MFRRRGGSSLFVRRALNYTLRGLRAVTSECRSSDAPVLAGKEAAFGPDGRKQVCEECRLADAPTTWYNGEQPLGGWLHVRKEVERVICFTGFEFITLILASVSIAIACRKNRRRKRRGKRNRK